MSIFTAKEAMNKNKEPLVRRFCFVCEEPLESTVSVGKNKFNQTFSESPSSATCWTTRGNYGSALFDQPPYETDFLEISICDACLSVKSELVFRVSTETEITNKVHKFVPHDRVGKL